MLQSDGMLEKGPPGTIGAPQNLLLQVQRRKGPFQRLSCPVRATLRQSLQAMLMQPLVYEGGACSCVLCKQLMA